MRFRIFIGLVCLAFVGLVLFYGVPDAIDSQLEQIPEAQPTPEFLAEISETLSCEGEDIAISNRPLVVGMVGRPNSLLPVSSTSRSQLEQELSQLIFRGLVRFTPEGEALPDLASWAVSEDGLTVTFRLDQGGFWHDGTPVTANDVVFTVSQLAVGNYSVPGNFPWNTVSVNQIDELTVQISLPVPYVPLLEAATVGLLPAHLNLDQTGLDNSEFAAQPIGNGRFRIENRWQSDGVLFMTSISDSFIKSVEMRFYPSAESMLADFGSDQLDIALLPQFDSILDLGEITADGYQLFSGPTNRSTQLFFRMDADESSIISDVNVRKALQIGLDRRMLLDTAILGQGVVADGPYGVGSRFNDGAQFPPNQTDVEAAVILLEEAGWLIPEGSLSGVREKAGEQLKVNIVLPSSPVMEKVGAELDRQWSDLGAIVEVELLPETQHPVAIEQRAFDATAKVIRLSNDPDVYHFFSQEAIVRGENISRWNHRPSSEALEAGRQVWEFELRKPYYTAFRSFYENEVPSFTLYQEVRSVFISQNLGGTINGYPGNFAEFMQPFPQWYIFGEGLEEECFSSDS
ncbi:MAG: peptide ABC transporter substrate-binding protein [Chloroflexota bacterium]